MRELTSHCIDFLRASINDVLRLPIELSCLSDALLARFAATFEPEDIDRLRDKKDKISSRLYTKKLEALLASPENTLHRCTFCTRLFTSAQREWEPCARAPRMLDFHGNAIAQHVPNRAWDLHRWVGTLRRGKGGAREAFWRLWGLTRFLTCSVCSVQFPLAELEHCTYHPSEPCFERGENRGTYPCCGAPALRFDPQGGHRRGCCTRQHKPLLKPQIGTGAAADSSCRAQARAVEIALAHADCVLAPFDAGDAALWAPAPQGDGGGGGTGRGSSNKHASPLPAADYDSGEEAVYLNAAAPRAAAAAPKPAAAMLKAAARVASTAAAARRDGAARDDEPRRLRRRRPDYHSRAIARHLSPTPLDDSSSSEDDSADSCSGSYSDVVLGQRRLVGRRLGRRGADRRAAARRAIRIGWAARREAARGDRTSRSRFTYDLGEFYL